MYFVITSPKWENNTNSTFEKKDEKKLNGILQSVVFTFLSKIAEHSRPFFYLLLPAINSTG